MEPLRGTGPIQLPSNLEPTPAPIKAARPAQVASPTSGDIRALPPDEAPGLGSHGTPQYGDRVIKQGGGGDGKLDNYELRPQTGPLSLSQIDLGSVKKSAKDLKLDPELVQQAFGDRSAETGVYTPPLDGQGGASVRRSGPGNGQL